MTDVREHREWSRQEDALGPAAAAETPATSAYRRMYSGIRWAPLPALRADFSSQVLLRAGLASERESTLLERRLMPLLWAALGIGGGVTAGPQLAAVAGQWTLEAAGLPWVQPTAALAAIAAAAVIDRAMRWRRQTHHLA